MKRVLFLNAYKLLLVFILITYGCAQVIMPTGGEKDTTPPVIISQTPKNKTTSFNSNEIVIEFDEFIKIQKLTKELAISPCIKNNPEITVKNKKLIIKTDEVFNDSITYVIDFGASIVDITENNPANIKYVFSRNSFVDSSFIEGKILDASFFTPIKNITVLAYKENIDSLPYLEKPYYYTKTDNNGCFKLTNIKKGSYKIFALNDENSNLIYDNIKESIAFIDTLVKTKDEKINDSTIKNNELVLYMFNEKPKKIKVNNSNYEKPKLTLTFNDNLVNPKFKVLNKPDDNKILFKYFNKTMDTVTLWLNPSINDSSLIEITDNSNVIDTLKLFKLNTFKKNKPKQENNLILVNKTKEAINFLPEKGIKLNFSQPIDSVYLSGIKCISNDDTIDLNYNIDSIDLKTCILTGKFNVDKEYNLVIMPKSIVSYYKKTNDTLKLKCLPINVDDYGQIIVSLSKKYYNEYNGCIILQLLNEKSEVIKEVQCFKEDQYDFNSLKPGNYKFRIVYDENSDNKWNTGHYLNKKQPEKVVLFNNEILVKSKWETKVDLE